MVPWPPDLLQEDGSYSIEFLQVGGGESDQESKLPRLAITGNTWAVVREHFPWLVRLRQATTRVHSSPRCPASCFAPRSGPGCPQTRKRDLWRLFRWFFPSFPLGLPSRLHGTPPFNNLKRIEKEFANAFLLWCSTLSLGLVEEGI